MPDALFCRSRMCVDDVFMTIMTTLNLLVCVALLLMILNASCVKIIKTFVY